MLFRWARGVSSVMVSVFFVAVIDSPVRGDSSILRLMASISLPSAGILSPSQMSRMSPGTISRAGMSLVLPSLITLLWGETICFRASTACSARYSWMNPMIELSTTMMSMTAISVYS